ncbi:MAG: hypothetical protein ABIM59_04365 [candidate division WOR-3 bacterium]
MYEILSISLLIAQGTWAKRYEAERYDYARAIVQKADGGYLVAGYTSSFGAGGGDFLLASLTTDGDLLWAKVYGGSGDDLAYDLALVPGGHVIVVGESLSFGMGGYDAVVFRADPSGNLVWIRVIGGLYNDGFTKVIDHSGGVLIAGYTQSAGAGNSDILLVKMDYDGNIVWAKTYGGSASDGAYAIAPYGNEAFVSGRTWSFSHGQWDIFAMKTDEQGNCLWFRAIGGTSGDYSESILPSADGGCWVIGYTDNLSPWNGDILVSKFAGNGDISWSRAYGGPSADIPHSAFLSLAGEIIIAGRTWSFGAGGVDFLAFGLDQNGEILWSSCFGGEAYDWARASAEASDGFVFAGHTTSFSAQNQDLVVIKTDKSGYYENCLFPVSLYVQDCQVDLIQAEVGQPWNPDVMSPDIVISGAQFSPFDLCVSVSAPEDNNGRLACHNISGGILFESSRPCVVKIYRPDGQMHLSRVLYPGKNFIALRPGVYFYTIGTQRGNLFVR